MSFTRRAGGWKSQKKETVELIGLVRKINRVFPANERGAATAIVSFLPDGAPEATSLKCSAEVATLTEGTRYKISGYWSSYKAKHKFAKNPEVMQFVAEAVERVSELDFESFSAYLTSIVKEDWINGIGQGRISRMWREFGNQALLKIRETPNVDAWNSKNRDMAIDQEAWSKLREGVARRQFTESTMSEILKLIAGFGFYKSVAKEAFDKWGAQAADKIRRNPFCLMIAEFPGAGFKRCDELYRSLGGNPARLKRLMLRIWYEIKNGVQGNCWTDERQLRQTVRETIEAEFDEFGIPRDAKVQRQLDRAIELGIRSRWLSREWTKGVFGPIANESSVKGKGGVSWIASKEIAGLENEVATRIARTSQRNWRYWEPDQQDFLLALNVADVIDGSNLTTIEEAIASKRKDIDLAWGWRPTGFSSDFICKQLDQSLFRVTSRHQRQAIYSALKPFGFGCLTGGPGTGKTRATCGIISLADKVISLHSRHEPAVMACGPTGKSVSRLRESYESIYGSNTLMNTTFSTWHSALWNWADRIPRVIIGDEQSMTDIEMQAAILRTWPFAIYLFVGDDDQLPPVGPGHVLRDMMRSGKVPVGTLTETHRNEGGIVTICEAIAKKKTWDPHGNVLLTKVDEPARIADEIKTRIASAVIEGYDPVKDVQVICAVNEKGDVSKAALNLALQQELNGGNWFGSGAPESCPFRPGDKVVCRKNGRYHAAVGPSGQPWTSPLAGPGAQARPGVAVCNGDQGVVLDFPNSNSMIVQLFDDRDSRIIVNFNEDEPKSYHKGARCHWELAYAISCHSAQGSEWPVSMVVLDPSSSASGICNLEWLRVAISRGKHRAEMFGTMETARTFCRKSGKEKRRTLLAEKIQREIELLEMDL